MGPEPVHRLPAENNFQIGRGQAIPLSEDALVGYAKGDGEPLVASQVRTGRLARRLGGSISFLNAPGPAVGGMTTAIPAEWGNIATLLVASTMPLPPAPLLIVPATFLVISAPLLMVSAPLLVVSRTRPFGAPVLGHVVAPFHVTLLHLLGRHPPVRVRLRLRGIGQKSKRDKEGQGEGKSEHKGLPCLLESTSGNDMAEQTTCHRFRDPSYWR